MTALRRAFETPRARAALHELRRLAPVWWVVRAYVFVAALVLASGGSWSLSHPSIPHVVDGAAAPWHSPPRSSRRSRSACAARCRPRAAARSWSPTSSCWRRRFPSSSTCGRARPCAPQVVEFVSEPVGGLAVDGTPVRNVYAYSRDGQLLHDVLLYDDAGSPLNVGGPNAPDPNRRVLVTTTGVRLYNTFPIRYYDPGTRRVRHPNAGAPVRPPRLLTPPLRLRKAR